MSTHNLYTNTANLYDFDNRELLNYDLNISLDCLRKTKGDILELACGTGRTTIPILNNASDRSITAIDLSDEMLAVFKKKILKLSLLSDNLELIKGDMCDFNLNKKFGLIILIWRSFQLLIQEEDSKKCLLKIREHMEKDSLFLINVFLPKESYGEEWLGKEFLSYETIDESNYKVVRSTKNLNSDEEKQIIEYASIYNITSPDGNHEKLEDKMILRYYYPDQIKKLLTDYNFNIIEERKTEDDLFLICGLSQE